MNQETEIKARVLDRLIEHFDNHKEVQNIDLMILAKFCRNCLSGYISIASESRSGLRIVCPDSKCKLLISEKNLKALVTNDAVYR